MKAVAGYLGLVALLCVQPVWGGEHEASAQVPQAQPVAQATLDTAALKAELATMQTRITELERTPRLSAVELAQRNRQLLAELAGQVRAQRQTMHEFSGFVTWLSGSLEGYNRYLQASAVAANLIRVLPIPYAGQASMFTKFAAQGVVSLNSTSASISHYLHSSQQFLTRYDALEKQGGAVTATELSGLIAFAAGPLQKDTADLQQRLSATAELSTAVLGFLEGVNGYLGSADQYWSKTKAFVTRNEDAAREKGYLAGSIAGLRSRAGQFAGRLQAFSDLSRKNEPQLRTLQVYDRLIAELRGAEGGGQKQ